MIRALAVSTSVMSLALAGSLAGSGAGAMQSKPAPLETLLGTVKLPGGTGAAGGAKAYLCQESESGDGVVFSAGVPDDMRIEGLLVDGLGGHLEKAVCDREGRFRFAEPSGPFAIAILHEQGYVEVTDTQFKQEPVLTLKAWGRIEGVLQRGRAPRPNVEVWLYARARGYDAPRVAHAYAARTDDQGRFTIERVTYGKGNLGPMAREAQATHMEYQQPVLVAPGQTTHVNLGGRGQPIVGRVAAPAGVNVDFASAYQSVHLRKKGPDVPDDVREQGKESFEAWWKAWLATDEGRKWDALPSSFASALDLQGAFRLEEVPAGPWTLMVDLIGPVPAAKTPRVAFVGRLVHDFVAPELAQERSDEPLDLGTLTADPVPIPLQVGDDAPAFEATTLDGRTIKLTELRGKIVLLDFWATWCGPCLQQMPKIKALYEKFAQDKRFALLGISLDRKREKLVEYIRENDIRWPQVLLEDGTKAPLAQSYRVEGIPTVVLVDPDGKVLAYKPSPTELQDLVARWLTTP